MGGVLFRLVDDERGTTAIEYGLIAGLVTIVIVSALEAVGLSLSSLFTANFQEVEAVRRCVQVGSSCNK